MGWMGIAVGGYLGSIFGGPLGALLGAVLGHNVEKRIGGGSTQKRRASYAGMSDQNRAMVFCASAAAMLAKLAKADGRVTRNEINQVETAFARLGFSSGARAYAIDVFRRAKDDAHTIDEYAAEFASAVSSVEVRELFYEILWDLACADGRVTDEERTILARMPRVLGIRPAWFGYFASARLYGGASSAPASRNELDEAYAILGVCKSDSNETLRRTYRKLAKANHPDALRAKGLPEEMVGKATERMSRINTAWATIRAERGIS